MFLQFGRGEGRRFVDKFLFIFQKEEFDFPTFCEVLKIRKHRSQIMYGQSNVDLMNAGFGREFIEIKEIEGKDWPRL